MTARLAIPDRVCSRESLRRRGFTDAELRAATSHGELLRIAHDLYVPTAWYLTMTPKQQYLTRIRAEAERGFRHGGQPRVGDCLVRPALADPAGDGSSDQDRYRRRTQVRRPHRACREPPRSSHLVVNGVDVTTVARTLVDLARSEPLSVAVVAGDAALHRKVVRPEDLQAELLAATACKGHPGARRAVAALDARSESPGESVMRLTMVAGSLPAPELQVEIYDENGVFVARVDGAYPQYGIVIEFDGHSKYTSLLRPGQDVTDVVLAEKRREERLSALGWHMVRVIWSDFRNPAALVHRITEAIRARRPWVRSIRGTITLASAA